MVYRHFIHTIESVNLNFAHFVEFQDTQKYIDILQKMKRVGVVS